MASPAFLASQDETTLRTIERTWIAAIINTDRVTLDTLPDGSFIETAPNGMHRNKSNLLLALPSRQESTPLIDVNVR